MKELIDKDFMVIKRIFHEYGNEVDESFEMFEEIDQISIDE